MQRKARESINAILNFPNAPKSAIGSFGQMGFMDAKFSTTASWFAARSGRSKPVARQPAR